MSLTLRQEFDELLEPLGSNAANFFLAASLYHAHKISFSAAATLANLGFEEFLHRLKEHFGTGFFIADETIEEDFKTVAELVENK